MLALLKSCAKANAYTLLAPPNYAYGTGDDMVDAFNKVTSTAAGRTEALQYMTSQVGFSPR
jgi:hypothetical protein